MFEIWVVVLGGGDAGGKDTVAPAGGFGYGGTGGEVGCEEGVGAVADAGGDGPGGGAGRVVKGEGEVDGYFVGLMRRRGGLELEDQFAKAGV